MAAELLQNLIPNVNQIIQQNNQSVQNYEEVDIEKFSKLFDGAKEKYNSKETFCNHREDNSQTVVKNANESKAWNKDRSSISRYISNETNNNNNDTNKDNNVTSTCVVENNNLKTIEDLSSSDIATSTDEEGIAQEKFVVESLGLVDEKHTKFSGNILNNILLGNISNSLDEDTEKKDTQSDVISVNVEDAMLNVVSEEQVENTQTIEVENISKTNTKDDILLSQEKAIVNNDVNNELIDKNSLTIKANDTLNTLKQFDKSVLGEGSISTSSELINGDLQEIENLEKEALVKVDEVIDLAMDDIASEFTKETTNDSSNTKISQNVIDELDVTIRSAVSSDAKSQGGNTSNFNNSRGNAQENIIKMSLEQPTYNSTIVSESTTFDNVISETVQVKTPEINLGNLNNTSLNNLSSQNLTAITSQQIISDTEILSQINNKLTLPQDNVTNKINIILQPEQLGKISVEIMQTKDGIVAKMVADTVQVKDLLDKSIESLKNTLANQGVNVNNITVKIEESAAAQNSNFGFEQEQFNREAANQSNQQKHSSNSEYSEDKNNTDSSNSNNAKIEEPEIVESNENQINDNVNQNGSISIRV